MRSASATDVPPNFMTTVSASAGAACDMAAKDSFRRVRPRLRRLARLAARAAPAKPLRKAEADLAREGGGERSGVAPAAASGATKPRDSAPAAASGAAQPADAASTRAGPAAEADD